MGQTIHCAAICILDKNQLLLSLLNAIDDEKNANGNGLMIDISNDLCSITPVIKYQIVQRKIILSTFHTGIRMNEDINIRVEQPKNLLFNLKCKMAQTRSEYDALTQTNQFEKKIDPFLYMNGESLFDCKHSMALNLNVKKRDYSVFSYDEFKEKTIFDGHSGTTHSHHHHHHHKKRKKTFVFNKTKGKDLKIGFIKGLHELIWQCVDSF